jgi:hypothetical protein
VKIPLYGAYSYGENVNLNIYICFGASHRYSTAVQLLHQVISVDSRHDGHARHACLHHSSNTHANTVMPAVYVYCTYDWEKIIDVETFSFR